MAEGCGGGEAFLVVVEASIARSHLRCACGCDLLADAAIPLEVIVENSISRDFFCKTTSYSRDKRGRLLAACVDHAKAAQNTQPRRKLWLLERRATTR